MRLPHHRRRHHPRRHGDDGSPRDQGGGGIRPRRLSARRRGTVDCRARRPGGRGRSSDRTRGKNRARVQRGRMPRLDLRRGAAAVLGRPQGGVPGGGAHLAGLLLHGRHHPARAVAARARGHARDVGEIRSRRRQRVPRRRRQPASAHSLRRQQGRRARPRRAVRRRYFEALRRGRRRFDRRARRRRREARPDGRDVLRDRSRPAAARQMRLRPERPAQPRQGVSDAAPLRRTRPHAHLRRQAAVSRIFRGFKRNALRYSLIFPKRMRFRNPYAAAPIVCCFS